MEKLRHRTVRNLVCDYAEGAELDCLKDLTGGIEYAAKILNEITQKDIQCTKRASKAGKEGNGQDWTHQQMGNAAILSLFLARACVADRPLLRWKEMVQNGSGKN